jgi:ribosome-associated toxin RatA of RatAB toxin-antitoxin module
MTRIERSALMPFPAEQVFALVNDIEAYPQYMDGCVGAKVLRSEGDLVEARLDLARGGVRQSFSTRNRSRAPHAIELELLEGPFEHFAGCWQFQSLGEAACKVSLDLQFRLRGGLLGAAAGKLFESVAPTLVDAVDQRARRLFGSAS